MRGRHSDRVCVTSVLGRMSSQNICVMFLQSSVGIEKKEDHGELIVAQRNAKQLKLLKIGNVCAIKQ